MQKDTLAILHFNPIELYPPIINLLNFMAEQLPDLQIWVFTCSTQNNKMPYVSKGKNIRIQRFAVLDPQLSLTQRYRNYFRYYYKTYQSLKALHPEWIWYFETISALPVSWYFKHKNFQDSKLLIHYHEYVAPEEYQNSPFMIRWIHKGEKKLYQKVQYLSQTNEKRMDMFLRDEKLSLGEKAHIFPNYPPKSWIAKEKGERKNEYPIKIVHAGSIGMDSLYIKEFCRWVDQQGGRVEFDVYSNQSTQDLAEFLSREGLHFTNIKGYIPYEDLPSILYGYHVGVILYKGVITNHVYAVSNKLFEYWACGLDVWFSDKMLSSLEFARSDYYPKLLPMNFEKLHQLDLAAAISHEGLGYQSSPYYCEPLVETFFEKCSMTGNKGISRKDVKAQRS